jgi:O-Antigen ligase
MQNLLAMQPHTFLAITYCGYFFFCTVPHTSAARYSFLALSLLASLFAIYKYRSDLSLRSSIAFSVCGFTLAAGLSAVLSPYALDNLSDFRKDYLTPGLLILFASALPWSAQQSKRFIYLLTSTLAVAFFVKTSLAFWDGAINHSWFFSSYSYPDLYEQHGLPRYVSFFAVEATLYIPLLMGILLFRTQNTTITIMSILGVILAYIIILVSGIRSSFIVTTLGIVSLLLWRYSGRKHVITFVVTAIIIGGSVAYFARHNVEVQRYISIFNPESYSQKSGMSDRYPIWVGTYEVTVQRPLFGFGPGWKKIPTVASDTGLLDSWHKDSSYYGQRKSYWFSLLPGQTNPHNLAMQIMFETGWIGLFLYLSILVSLIFSTRVKKESRGNNTVNESLWLSRTVPVFMICYLSLCITNGFLYPTPLVLLLVIAAVQIKSSVDKGLVSSEHI